MLGFDYVGMGTLITALAASVVSIIVALRQTSTHTQLAEVQNAVKTSNGQTLGEYADASEARRVADEASGGKA